MKKFAIVLLVAAMLGSCVFVLTACNLNRKISDDDFQLYCGKWQVTKYETKDGLELSANQINQWAALLGKSDIIDYITLSKQELSYDDSLSEFMAKISGNYREHIILARMYYIDGGYDMQPNTKIVDDGIYIGDVKFTLENGILTVADDQITLYFEKK